MIARATARSSAAFKAAIEVAGRGEYLIGAEQARFAQLSVQIALSSENRVLTLAGSTIARAPTEL